MSERGDTSSPYDPEPEGSNVVLMPPGIERGRWRRRRRTSRRSARALVAAAVLLVLGGLGTWLWLRGRSPEVPAGSEVAQPQDGGGVEGPGEPIDPAPGPAAEPLGELPPPDASDELVRRAVAGLSQRPQWASWLVNDRLIRRFVLSTVRLAAGSSPDERVEFLAPGGEFSVRESGGRTVIDPASYRRFDAAAATFASLDTEGAARLYRQLHPLFEEVHRELGFAEDTFDDAFERAVRNLLAVEIPAGPVEVRSEDGVWVYRDPSLESRSPAAKQLLRMGPDNALLVQSKLREVAAALDLDVTG